MPTFGKHELTVGKTLGMGGFGIVSEINKFNLDPDPPPDSSSSSSPQQQQQQPVPSPASNHSSSENPQQPQLHHSKNPGPLADEDDEDDDTQQEHQPDHLFHFDVKGARQFMAQRCMRRGSARYAIKRLHGCLSAVERARGMIDLAVEAKYLSVVWHPNISECCVM